RGVGLTGGVDSTAVALDIPTLYVAGEKDMKYGGTKEAMRAGAGAGAGAGVSIAGALEATCPGVKVCILTNCGHAVPTERPDALYREVAFLLSQSQSRSQSEQSRNGKGKGKEVGDEGSVGKND
ncbi:unnamed protein product, partial [Discosporangium mesarthrocarpum]